MCEEICTSIIWSLFPICRGDKGCGSCNPPCCRKVCTCGFDEDDQRYLDQQDGATAAAPPVGEARTGAQGVGVGAGAQPAYEGNRMVAPGGQ
ncbi:hypothetical protein JCM9279_003911 [Rhodotorula babjevae]